VDGLVELADWRAIATEIAAWSASGTAGDPFGEDEEP
jgi:hypothetical protein